MQKAKESFEKPLLSTIEIMSQPNRKSIGLLSDLECAHNKSVENGAFVLILKCTHLCRVYALIIQSYLASKGWKIDAS